MNLDDTIAAIATPLGEGGLAVVRLSGANALSIADKSFRPVGKNSLKPSAAPTHTIQFGKIVRAEQVIDEAGRTNEVTYTAHFSVTYWADHAVKEVRIVDVRRY